jgi:hypothetical protein
MKVLVACEFSGIVSSAFRKAGHDAYSCDLSPSRVPEFHLQMDMFEAVKLLRPALLIAHPPCTYLSKAQIFMLYQSPDRLFKSLEAVYFVEKIMSLDVPMIAIENPPGVLGYAWKRYTQVVNACDFGDSHFKQICLWLKNLPPLICTCHNPVRRSMSNHVNGRMSQAVRSQIKSTFFPLVAEAMVNQWGSLV